MRGRDFSANEVVFTNRKWILRGLIAVFALGFVITGSILIWRAVTAQRTQARLEEARQMVSLEEPEETPAEPEEAEQPPRTPEEPAQSEPEEPPQPEAPAEPETIKTPPEAEPQPEFQPEVPPEPEEGETPPEADALPPLLDKYLPLLYEYPDFAGWLTIGKNDIIDTLVVRATDNEFYLDHDFTGASAWGGAIFMDCYDALEPLSRNTILYGHHLADQFSDRMFGELESFKTPSYTLENQTFYFATPFREYTATIFAVYTLYPSDWRLYSVEFADDQDFLDYCNDAISRSRVDCGVTVQPEDKIITLSTCDYTANDYRLIVQAVLTPLE